MNEIVYLDEINSNLNFLLVDDDPQVIIAIKSILKKAGFKNIHTAENGIMALEKLRKCGIDLVFLDWDMPGMNGAETLEEMNRAGLLKVTKVLMVTAHSQKDYVLSAMQLGASGYVVKPFTPLLVYNKLEKIFKANICTS